MATQAMPTHSDLRSPIRDAFQQKPSSPPCRSMVPVSGLGLLSKMVCRNPRRKVHVTMKRRMTVMRLEKSKMADCGGGGKG